MHPALVIVIVKSATRVENPGWNTWRVIAEAPGNVRYDFRSTLSSDGCGQTPLPQNGDTWIVYYERARSGEAVDAFPLDHVREYDPRLADVH